MNTEVENEIVTWKFRTRLMLAVVICSAFVPLMVWVVRMTVFLIHAGAEPTHGSLVAAGLAELAMSVVVLVMIVAAMAICVYHAVNGAAEEVVPETARSFEFASDQDYRRVVEEDETVNLLAARHRFVA